ncbi:DUF488 domain-containing protein [Olivibacter domesticus]|uniref:Uncharacterized conserved protein YeaO, DUF488 family n=1 Tax=Olivibacter domesticus TaxID=407022 RepID=A0A1H7I867_OLID1|nr:DUF488 family protein [Olivibacter domesticus]SEK58032.1 Uncharacterized conserved protein YeaO, DUF488 family [Olivibacter domesticus]
MPIYKVKRIYDPIDKHDGFRILVDRLWPRGFKKDDTRLDFWFKEVAPSPTLRKWFDHEDEKWEVFKKRYLEELRENKKKVDEFVDLLRSYKIVTLLYAAHNKEHNHVEVLKIYLETEN